MESLNCLYIKYLLDIIYYLHFYLGIQEEHQTTYSVQDWSVQHSALPCQQEENKAVESKYR